MSNQAEIDYEKKFQEDLAKATALSLEQQALDEYNRTKKYGAAYTQILQQQQQQEAKNQYYAKLKRQQIQTQTAVNEKSQAFPQRRHSEVASTSGSGTTHPLTKVKSNFNLPHIERSRTPSTAAHKAETNATTTTTIENDLINFASPPGPEKVEGGSTTSTFEKLIEDLQMLHTQQQHQQQPQQQHYHHHTALVPLGPTAAAPLYPVASYLPSHSGIGNIIPTSMPPPPLPALQAYPSAHHVVPNTNLQMVPFMPPLHQQHQQKVPLTPNELQKLYNMPMGGGFGSVRAGPGVTTTPLYAARHMGFIAPQAQQQLQQRPSLLPPASNYYTSSVPFMVQGGVGVGVGVGVGMAGGIYSPSTSQTYNGFHYPPQFSNYYHHTFMNTSNDLALHHKNGAGISAEVRAGTATGINNQNPHKQKPSGTTEAITTATATSTGRRSTPPSRLACPSTIDLIDLGHPEEEEKEIDSRVSVLEAFDPLLNEANNGDTSSSDSGCNDNGIGMSSAHGGTSITDDTSYYAEYDPFDYLYSEGGTQYSDPVYEAVNKFDQSLQHQQNNKEENWRSHYVATTTVTLTQNYDKFHEKREAKELGKEQSRESMSPPPLPPRNTSGYSHELFTHKRHISRELYSTSKASISTTSVITAASSNINTTHVLDRRKVYSRLYEMVTEQCTIDTELLDFYYMVKELRQHYSYDDIKTNVGHIIASEFNYHYPEATSIKILVHPYKNTLITNMENGHGQTVNNGVGGLSTNTSQFKGYGAPVVFTCDINTTIELIIVQAVCNLEGQIYGTVNDYVIKPIGVSEWLANTSKLSQLECVHNSLKLEQDVHLGLCLKTSDNMNVIDRTERDDINHLELRLEDVLPNEMATCITYDNMMILIETLETEIDKLESAALDITSISSTRSVLSCSGVVQGVKAICALLGSIDTLEIATYINDLKGMCEKNHLKSGAVGSKASAVTSLSSSPKTLGGSSGVASEGEDDGLITASDPEILNDCGDYTEVALKPRSLLEQIKFKCNQIRDAVQELIELYSNVFRVGFSVKSIDYSSTPIHVSYVIKPIMVSINCLHRPPPLWKYDNYSLGVQINYGTRFISDPVVTKCSNDTTGGLFPRLNFSSWITFEKNPICTLPREARLIFVLYGTQQMAETDININDNCERRQITTELGWCAIQLFDYKREMICGPYLLSIWPATADKFLGPAPAKGCHPQPDYCPVLSIEIPPYGGRIQFPEALENPPPAPKYDFNSLDMNLQQELLDTAEQGYMGATDKREVFWEKRLYLQNFPNALPKVLHAAHSWDYASLMDLHSLLHSWSALSPLQALELLLPRYPDAKVREKAVQWIGELSNDQLVDYLPQLLQSLKHDTYEASSMARFLLSKSLESPRIAHHMYWLLVHCLPGDDPQNSIDTSSMSSEIDESLITQARYYRRNKMMLRALLAICGEKLSKRFLLQNFICKNLANIAESVKEAKESIRQKVLCAGMDNVHQELYNKPTCLPLGPELEVSGVSVRHCSYFNSNTLPLKISFITTDNQILPAIFKAGDDLQQDMLTIQLIRVMNKMWLAEGLDLKIVTFNCVPTGYKRGMIELVSDAETLRKIQVEYGLTGSFKDRPIAEWLAKQNPSQLEYQRAVKNFTVSCAGYSVATYILGICDRHNDNIMLKTSGHLFHIDFGKFLGDAQMFGNFKRDRTPFVLTSDMAYVINGGEKASTDFHYFVDLCCRAFNIIRKHGDLILHMLALMATAGIPGVTADAVTYVRKALLPSQSNPEAAASFAKMIQFSLKSWFTQFNFFLHNLAQMRFSNDEGNGELLSFVPRKYTLQQDGRLKSVMVVRCQKHYDMEKYYTYILRVTRHGQPDPVHLFRSYKEFTEFHQKLCLHFPLAKLHSLPSGIHVGRSNIKSVAERRLPEIQKFLLSLFNSADEIAHSDLVYTFFHPLLRDQQEANLEMSKVKEMRPQILREHSSEVGQLKLSLQYRREVLTVMIHHAKGLPLLQGGQEPSTYVKCYLKPDDKKATKRKTKVVRKTCVPSYMETLEYRMPLDVIRHRVLHVTVWSHDTLQENELLGGFQIDLQNYDLKQELIDWFRLGFTPRH